MKKRILLTASLVLSTLSAVQAHASDTPVDTHPAAQWRAQDQTGSRYLEAVGDFDGDGQPDRARLQRGDAGETSFKLVLVLSRDASVEHVLKQGTHFQSVGIETVKPGLHKTACSKGAGPDTSPCVEAVNVPQDALSLFTVESGAVLLYAQDGVIKEVAVAD